MKIAVLSDIHDNIWQLAKTIQLIKSENGIQSGKPGITTFGIYNTTEDSFTLFIL